MTLFGPDPDVITCRGCGCDDDHACVTAEGPCEWVVLDIEMATGVCSACAAKHGWDQNYLASVWTLGMRDEEAA